MYWEFNIAWEPEPITKIDKNGNRVLTDGHNKFFLKDTEGYRISSYYDKIVYLGKNHFAVANYEPHIVFFKEVSEGKVVDTKISARDVNLKWGVIKMGDYKINGHTFWGESVVIPSIYTNILPNNNNTIVVEHFNKITFVDLDEKSENYSKQIFPCLFTKVSNFDIDYKDFVEVTYKENTGYIPRNIGKNDSDINLLNKTEVAKLTEYFNDKISLLDFDTRYKYMCLTNETPVLTKILKNKK